ncbi:hypothetical protein [Methylobacterium radiotolerans]
MALGDDSDTTGAVPGQLAGTAYGNSIIPDQWTIRLHASADFISLINYLLSFMDRFRSDIYGRYLYNIQNLNISYLSSCNWRVRRKATWQSIHATL